jgi:RTX calcium-binding nonapeptide repeat (4 copies)
MRRTGLSVAVVAITTLLACGVALALPLLVGTARSEELEGTRKAEEIRALAGQDHVYARGGADVVKGGPDNDTILVARDISEDRVSCGQGRNDTVVADPNDRVDGVPASRAAADVDVTCENVRVVVTPPSPPS